MNDLLSPTMMIMEDEVDSFWCFKGIMDNMVGTPPRLSFAHQSTHIVVFPDH
jgi:hypothetical protein